MSWQSLTWATIEDWAGLRSVERGREYCRAGRVTWLGTGEGGDIVAKVRGGARYACRVRLEGDRIRSRCTCPHEGAGCKHAVAAALTYLDALRHGRDVPPSDEVEWMFPELEGDAVTDLPDDADQLREAIEAALAWPVPSACEETLPLLRRLRALLYGAGRQREWDDYEAWLRAAHWRRPRMQEVLDRLRTRRVIPAPQHA